MHLIEVSIDDKKLYFHVEKYKIENGRCIFVDRVTNLTKNFPQEKCNIEEVAGRENDPY